jgi:sugar/nucleoside kinase (ribokinase family)
VIICLGEAIVDLVSEGESEGIEDAEAFRPRFGGALANVAVAAARRGAPVALAGGGGADPWGRWLRDRLAQEDVDLRFFSLLDDTRTPIAFVAFGHDREPRFLVYGGGIEATIGSIRGRLDEALDLASGLIFGSNTLVGEPERELTMRARQGALSRGVPVVFDPNLRPHRWRDLELARELCREVCAEALCVRANLEEARWLAGLEADADAGEAASRIAALRAELAIVTRGRKGALIRGAVEAEHPGIAVETVSPLGAGDAFIGTLVAELAKLGWDATRAPEALPAAVEAAARTCTVWRAVL